MHTTRAVRIALAGTAFLAACSDSSTPILAPTAANHAASGTYTTTLWKPDASGHVQYVGTRTGTFRTTAGRVIVDSGRVVQLDPATVTARASAIETDQVLKQLSADGALTPTPAGGFAASRSPNRATNTAQRVQRRPGLRNARTLDVGTVNGRSIALQLAGNPNEPGQPAAASIITADGKPIAFRDARFRKTSNGWQTTRNTTTLIDSTSNATLIIDTEYGNDAVSSLGTLDRVRASVSAVGDALATVIAPAALHAEAAPFDSAIPCQDELSDLLKAVAAWGTAMAALTGAEASCPMLLYTCAAIPFLWATTAAADVALGVAGGIYTQCMWNYTHPQWTGSTTVMGGADGITCYLIDWYESFDGGKTWKYTDSTYQCGRVYEQ